MTIVEISALITFASLVLYALMDADRPLGRHMKKLFHISG